jgi:predicted GIY-YIG superfamily endonuclease
MTFIVYILRCSDGTYYTGLTSDLDKRLDEHESGAVVNSYTFSRRPIHMEWAGEFPTYDEAINFERQVKGWSRAKKKALIKSDWVLIHQIVHDERKRREKKKIS